MYIYIYICIYIYISCSLHSLKAVISGIISESFIEVIKGDAKDLLV